MCTVFVKNTSKGMVAARNHSWTQPGGNVHFIPPQRIYGKLSNAMYLMDQWGQDRPFEGINEHGLFIGAAGIPDDLSPLGKQKRQPPWRSFARSPSPTIWTASPARWGTMSAIIFSSPIQPAMP